MKGTVIITTFNRPKLLRHGLNSLAKQNLSSEIEVVVVNDGDVSDETESVCNSVKNLDVTYLPIDNNHSWRVPGFAINYAVKQTDSDVIFISCAEMYHLDDTIEQMISAFEKNKKILVIPDGKDDIKGDIFNKVNNNKIITNEDYQSLVPLGVILPFFMGMNRKDFEDIGGYDEDFVGFGYDDNDIIDRMKSMGNKYYSVNARVIHLWHQRLFYSLEDKNYKYNYDLYEARKGILVRNEGKNWGNG